MADTLTPSKLWKKMTADQRLRAAQAFWEDADAVDDHVQAALLIAQQKKFRPKFVLSLDLDRRAKHLASLASVSDVIAARGLIAYHLGAQRPMMGAFLDALDIAHEQGLIQEENARPEAAKLAPAAALIATQYPADDVRLYLNTLVCQDPETWSGLDGLPELAW